MYVDFDTVATHKGVNWLETNTTAKTWVAYTVTLTWHACKYEAHKLHLRHTRRHRQKTESIFLLKTGQSPSISKLAQHTNTQPHTFFWYRTLTDWHQFWRNLQRRTGTRAHACEAVVILRFKMSMSRLTSTMMRTPSGSEGVKLNPNKQKIKGDQ